MIPIFLFIIISGLVVMRLFTQINKNESAQRPLISSSEKVVIPKPNKSDVVGIYKDIYLQPYGCFSSLEQKFFQRKMNTYNKTIDSGLVISENNNDIVNLVQKSIDNGFDKYGYYLMNKYNGNYKNINIQEIGILGKLSGYNYISVFKYNEKTRGTIYLSYSPPLNQQVDFNGDINEFITKSDLPDYTLRPQKGKFTNELEKAPGKEYACGYPCNLPPTKDNKIFMCGSVGYPDIKTPSRFAVYKIAERQ